MRVLIACEFSGVVRRAFRERGHDAWSCDLLPAADHSTAFAQHMVGDVRDVLADGWDLMIAHPPCTYLCNSAVWALHKTPPNPTAGVLYGDARREAMEDAARLFRNLLDAPIPRIAIENPIMHRYARAIIPAKYRQIIHPHQFGNDASKATCLWLKGLPPLRPTRNVPPRMVNGKPRWGNQTDSGQNKLTPSDDRWAKRAETYPGIAAAMAEQWGDGQCAGCGCSRLACDDYGTSGKVCCPDCDHRKHKRLKALASPVYPTAVHADNPEPIELEEA